MNHNNFENLISLLNSSILTPFNLIQYLKIDNYDSLNITKENNTLIAKINFKMYKTVKSMYYVFDYNDKLLEVYNIDNDCNKSIVFSRKKEIDNILEESIANNKDCIGY